MKMLLENISSYWQLKPDNHYHGVSATSVFTSQFFPVENYFSVQTLV